MSLSTFDQAETFVAWVDISGFKQMMRDRPQAEQALNAFYSIGYDAVRHQNDVEPKSLNGLFVSDAGVLFTRKPLGDPSKMLASMLGVIERICRNMLERDYLVTASVAFGDFDYRNKAEFVGISKMALMGGAYLKAYQDNEIGSPRIKPGYCRIVKEGLPADLDFGDPGSPILSRGREAGEKHFNFYWMADNPERIETVEAAYREAESERWPRIKSALRRGAV